MTNSTKSLVAILCIAIPLASGILNVINNIVIGILFTVVIVLIIKWEDVIFYFKKNISTKTFPDREDATPDMISEIKEYKHLVFVGISHRSLGSYLIKSIRKGKGEVKWKTIRVFFASEDIGENWEKEDFQANINLSKIRITELLMRKRNQDQMPFFEFIEFRQCKVPVSYGGCFCTNEEYIDTGEVRFNMFYSVNYLPSDSDTKKSWTLKLKRRDTNREEQSLFQDFEDSYKFLLRESKSIGRFSQNTWDYSYSEWSDFISNFDGFMIGVNELLSGEDFSRKSILDIGSGTGEIAEQIVDNYTDAKITLVDYSSGMLHSASRRLRNKVNYKLTKFSPDLLRSDKFDYIILHLSIHTMVTKNSINRFAQWCKNRLMNNGKVLIGVHNLPEIDIEVSDPDWKPDWKDPFERELNQLISSFGNDVLSKIDLRKESFTKSDIINSFLSEGLDLVNDEIHVIEITMEDRKRLWSTPAILNTKIQVDKIGIEKGKKIVASAYEKVSGEKTKPRYFSVLKFEYNASNTAAQPLS